VEGMNGEVRSTQGGTNPCYEDEQGRRYQDEAVVPSTPSPSLVIEDADASGKQGNVEP
jgi:hypothetical protein